MNQQSTDRKNGVYYQGNSMYKQNRFVKKILRFKYNNLDNFIFIHINKTGGSSIGRALKIPFGHKTALETIDEIGIDRWQKRYTFAVVRNPWDKVVSQYFHRKKTDQIDKEDSIEFNDWVKLAYGEQDLKYYNNPKMFLPHYDWISDRENKILVNFICRFENLSQDFDYVCNQINKKAELPHLKASKRGNYRDYYEADTREIVASWFAKDIQNFNYQF